MDFVLPELALAGDREQMRADALAELESVGGLTYRAPPFVEVGDGTSTVRVAVDRTGAVVDVHFRSDWQRELTSSGLGKALLEARRNASVMMMNALALDALAKRERVRAGGDPEPVEPAPPPVAAVAPDIREIWRRLTESEDQHYRATKAARAAREVRTLRIFSGLLTATCEGRTITGIAVEPVLAHQAGADRLRSAAMELFQQAAQPIERDDR